MSHVELLGKCIVTEGTACEIRSSTEAESQDVSSGRPIIGLQLLLE